MPNLVAFYDTLGIRRMYSRLKPQASPRGKTDVKVGEFVAAEYELEWYLGEVIGVDDEDGELQEALKENNTFRWPTISDKLWVNKKL